MTNIVIISCSPCCLVGPIKATWVCASFDSNLVIISCSTCCLVGPIKASWVCASFDSNLVIISCSTAQTHVALTGPMRQQVLQLMMTRLQLTNIHRKIMQLQVVTWIWYTAGQTYQSKSYKRYCLIY